MKFFDKYVNGTYDDKTGTQKWEISDTPIESTHKSIAIPLHDSASVDFKNKFFVKGTPIKDAQPIYYIDDENNPADTYLTNGPSVISYDNYNNILGRQDNKLHKHLVYSVDDYRKFIMESNSTIVNLAQKTIDVITDYYDDLEDYYNNKAVEPAFNGMRGDIKQSVQVAIRDMYSIKMGINLSEVFTGPLVVDDTKINTIVDNVISIIFNIIKAENSFNMAPICAAVNNFLIQTYSNILKNAVSYIMDKYTDSDYSDDEYTPLSIKMSDPYTLRLIRDKTYNNSCLIKPTVVYLASEHDEVEPDDNYRMLVDQYNNDRARQQNITDGIKELGQ